MERVMLSKGAENFDNVQVPVQSSSLNVYTVDRSAPRMDVDVVLECLNNLSGRHIIG